LCFQLIVSRNQLIKLSLTILDIGGQLFLLIFLLLEVTLDCGQPSLRLNTHCNDPNELLLVVVFNLINFVPGFVLDLFAFQLIDFSHFVDLQFKILTVLVLFFLLQIVLNLKFFILLFLQQMQLRDLLSEALFLLFLLVK
jgi:hypothetical protein